MQQVVYVEHCELSSIATQAYLDPETFCSATNFFHDYLQEAIAISALNEGSKGKALFVGKVFSARLALVWVVIACMLSVLVGMTAGIFNGDSSYGLNIGFGMLAVLGWTQMVLAWQIRS